MRVFMLIQFFILIYIFSTNFLLEFIFLTLFNKLKQNTCSLPKDNLNIPIEESTLKYEATKTLFGFLYLFPEQH